LQILIERNKVVTLRIKVQNKGEIKSNLKQKMGNKVMRYCVINMDRELISEESTFLRLRVGDLKAETESETIAARDQAL
jgi:hypothetical protein